MWDIKYRPLSFGDVVGQEGSIQVLRARLLEGTAHDISYVFAGPHGCGKTTLARILARALLCRELDAKGNPCNQCDYCKSCLDETFAGFTEFDAASQGTTADMRSLVDSLAYDIPGVKKRVFLLDEAHRMSRDGQDVLLKAIEDKRMVVIFATTELTKIRDTIKSRCEVYEIRKTSRELLLERMQKVLQAEGVVFEDEAILKVIDLAKGHVRDILNKLETVSQTGPITLEQVQSRLNLGVSDTFFQILANLNNPTVSLPLLDTSCDQVGAVAVATGLAEAAMDAFKTGLGISVDSVPKEIALQAYQTLGESLPTLATYFLRQPYTSKAHLTCDLLQCSRGGLTVTSSLPAAPSLPVPVAVAAPVTSATSTTPTPDVTPGTEPPGTASVSQSATATRSSSKAPPLSRNDSAIIPPHHPRGGGVNRVEPQKTKSDVKREQTQPLTNLQFRAKVLSLLHVYK